MIINVRTEVRVNTTVCFTLFPPEMVGWPSLHVDSLLFKVLQLAGKTSSVTFGMRVISDQLYTKELNTGYLSNGSLS